MEGESASAPDRALIEIIDVAARAATAYERPDLLPRLERARRRIAEPDLTVLVAGEFKKGKSSLVNALLGTVVCPVDDDVATAVPTMVRYGSEPAARARYEGSDELEAIDPAELAAIVTEAAAGDRRVTAVEVELPRRLLQGGIRLVDTPGVGGLESAHGAVTLGAIAMADAVVFVTDASQELTAPELGFLQRVHGLCPNVRIVMTKTDFYPAWRRILELDRGHLAAAGLDFEILPTSSALRTAALRSERRDLNDESGFPALVAWLLEAGRNAQALSARASVHDVLRVVDQIRSTFAAERDALADPEAAAALVARLDEAKERADELKGRSARWTQTLGDGITDLGSDVNHALRSGMRTVIEESDEALEEDDPTAIWDEFQTTLEASVRDVVLDVYTMLAERAEAVAARVEEHFSDDEPDVIGSVAGAWEGLDEVDVKDPAAATDEPGRVASTLTALRGSYSGILMFNMLGGLLGLPAILPVTMVLGLFMGAKAMRDQKQKQLKAARQAARQSVRKYVDSVNQQVGKDIQDTLRRLQRELRDRFTERATEVQQTAVEALTAAKQSVEADRDRRSARLADLDAELRRLDALRSQAAALDPGATS